MVHRVSTRGRAATLHTFCFAFVVLSSCTASHTPPDVDECAERLDDCDEEVAVCTDVVGGFQCACAAGWTGTGHGAGSCEWNDPSLAGLATDPGGAALSPAFSPDATEYTVTLPRGESTTAFTPTVAEPTRMTITVAGHVVESGARALVTAAESALAPTIVEVVVTTESGATRTYRVVVRHGPTYVKASNTDAGDYFGWSASLSADGARLAVSATFERSSATGIDGDQADNDAFARGAVYVYAWSGTGWAQEAYIKPSNVGSSFGTAVSLSGDGSRLAVGADFEASSATGVNGDQDDISAGVSGAVYVFARSGTTWTQEAFVKASNTGMEDHFGNSVALSDDGARLAVGASFEDSSATGVDGDQLDNAGWESGAVYVFTRSGTTWAQEAYVKASNTGGGAEMIAGDYFGSSVALSGDGTRLAVGALNESSSATGIDGNQADNGTGASGAVYVFLRSGGTWRQEAYVKASNTGFLDDFGGSVSLSADGTLLVVGASGESSSATGVNGNQANDSAFASGAAYVFSRTGVTWTQEAYVKASNTGPGDQFGASVHLSADGTHLAVGALSEASRATDVGGDQSDDGARGSGAVYLFTRSDGMWAQAAYVKASNPDADDQFGPSVSLSADGTRLAVGAPAERSNAVGIDGNQSDNSAAYAGAAYVY